VSARVATSKRAQRGEQTQRREAAPERAGSGQGRERQQILVLRGVAVAEHPAHRIADQGDLRAARLRLHRRDARGQILEQIAVEIPVPIEILRRRTIGSCGPLDLQLAR
jgi:hypothetical protein